MDDKLADGVYTIYSGGTDTITIGGNYCNTNTNTITFDPHNNFYHTSMNEEFTVSGAGVATDWLGGGTVLRDGLHIKEGGDITIGDRSLTDSIDRIEERLGILHPNPELEDRWNQLKELRRQYMDMEKDILEKDKLMKTIKG
jgi:hypothetical protein